MFAFTLGLSERPSSQTAALLTFLFYLLSLHPEALKKLRDEIVELVPSGAPTYEDVRKLKYCMPHGARPSV